MNTLQTVSGISARIFALPAREPFMTAPDLAEVYGTETKRLGEQVKRNPKRFPEDFAFYLTEAEEDQMWSHFATTSAKKRSDLRPLVFTHAGAYALSAVLKTPVAAEVSVVIHRAFAAMERRALEDTRFLLHKLRTEALRRSSIRVQVIEGVRSGLDFETIWRSGSASRQKLATVIADLMELGLIERPPAGMPVRQMELFGHV